MSWPEEIYLQLDPDEDNDFGTAELDDVTWCQDRQNEVDIKYIRGDLVEEIRSDFGERMRSLDEYAKAKDREIAELKKELRAQAGYWGGVTNQPVHSGAAIVAIERTLRGDYRHNYKNI